MAAHHAGCTTEPALCWRGLMAATVRVARGDQMAITRQKRKDAFVGVRMTQEEVDAMARMAKLHCTSSGAILRLALRKYLSDAGFWPLDTNNDRHEYETKQPT